MLGYEFENITLVFIHTYTLHFILILTLRNQDKIDTKDLNKMLNFLHVLNLNVCAARIHIAMYSTSASKLIN